MLVVIYTLAIEQSIVNAECFYSKVHTIAFTVLQKNHLSVQLYVNTIEKVRMMTAKDSKKRKLSNV